MSPAAILSVDNCWLRRFEDRARDRQHTNQCSEPATEILREADSWKNPRSRRLRRVGRSQRRNCPASSSIRWFAWDVADSRTTAKELDVISANVRQIGSSPMESISRSRRSNLAQVVRSHREHALPKFRKRNERYPPRWQKNSAGLRGVELAVYYRSDWNRRCTALSFGPWRLNHFQQYIAPLPAHSHEQSCLHITE